MRLPLPSLGPCAALVYDCVKARKLTKYPQSRRSSSTPSPSYPKTGSWRAVRLPPQRETHPPPPPARDAQHPPNPKLITTTPNTVGFSTSTHDGAFGQGPDQSMKAKIVNLIASVRMVMRSMMSLLPPWSPGTTMRYGVGKS